MWVLVSNSLVVVSLELVVLYMYMSYYAENAGAYPAAQLPSARADGTS